MVFIIMGVSGTGKNRRDNVGQSVDYIFKYERYHSQCLESVFSQTYDTIDYRRKG